MSKDQSKLFMAESKGVEPSSPSSRRPSVSMGDSEVVLEREELPERFSIASMIGMYYSLGATPIAVGTYMSLIAGVGAGGFLFWGTFTGCVCQMFVCLSLAEIASSFPHTIGMAYWVASLAPPRYKRPLSYLTAVATTVQILFDGASSWVITVQAIAGTISTLTDGRVNLKSWQTFLMTVGLVLATIPLNTSNRALSMYGRLSRSFAYLINGLVVYEAVTILVRSPHKQSAYDVFVSVDNQTGWASLGVVFFLSTLPGTSCVTGFNYAAHITEEIPQPSKNVPRVLVAVSFMSGLASTIMIGLLSYCTVNPEKVASDPLGGMPLAQILWDAQRSRVLTAINLVLVCVVYTNSGLVFITTSSRFIWQVTKHGGLALGNRPLHLGDVNSRTAIPQNAIYFASFMYVLISLLQIATDTVTNAVLGFSFLCVIITYGIPIGLLIFRGRHHLHPDRWFNLGPIGLPINVFALCWLLTSSVFYAFPSYLPVTANNMNYAGPCFIGFMALFIPNWFFYSKKHFVTPKVLELRDSGMRKHVSSEEEQNVSVQE